MNVLVAPLEKAYTTLVEELNADISTMNPQNCNEVFPPPGYDADHVRWVRSLPENNNEFFPPQGYDEEHAAWTKSLPENNEVLPPPGYNQEHTAWIASLKK